MFFGGTRRPSSGPRKGDDVNHQIKVTLEDLYNGKTVKLAVNRQILVGESTRCAACDGRGNVVELRQIAMGMVQQLQKRCPQCGGEGYKVQKEKQRKVLEVFIEKGMRHNQKIVFRGMADEKPNMEPGNVNFIIQEKEHSLFKRKGADLLITKSLSLNEALCGFEWKLTHLDNREVVIKSKSGEIIHALSPDDKPFVKIVSGEGMPSQGNPFIKGDLYVLFKVHFPKDGQLTTNDINVLRKALPMPSMEVEYDKDKAEITHLEHADVKNFGKGGAVRSESAYEPDEDATGPQPVQCEQS
mmetsp:Transcript_31180/g.44264  ORF Transcript_31180/g.44264 Transcript_31180/m.44264 type:complete len:299 (-) Transcript_31180:158-1054(-)